jgi:hypothetical protein
MSTKRTWLAKVVSDKDQQEQAKALCKECHLEVHHGKWQDENKHGWLERRMR